ncbi:hypothetical protein GGR54DRAFT_463212 [Hypoxylon sp. NC1633]|nr:hypothetical protein GGR54DRAFT_463212 [Hypoxylon sp. NC1633]
MTGFSSEQRRDFFDITSFNKFGQGLRSPHADLYPNINSGDSCPEVSYGGSHKRIRCSLKVSVDMSVQLPCSKRTALVEPKRVSIAKIKLQYCSAIITKTWPAMSMLKNVQLALSLAYRRVH